MSCLGVLLHLAACLTMRASVNRCVVACVLPLPLMLPQEPSVGCLSSLAILPVVLAEIMKVRLNARLAVLLFNPSLQVQECAVSILRRLVDVEEYRNEILYMGLVDDLNRFIQSCTPTARLHAAQIIKLSSFRRIKAVDDEGRRNKFASVPPPQLLDEGVGPEAQAAPSPSSSRPSSGRTSSRSGSSPSRPASATLTPASPPGSSRPSATAPVPTVDTGSPEAPVEAEGAAGAPVVTPAHILASPLATARSKSSLPSVRSKLSRGVGTGPPTARTPAT